MTPITLRPECWYAWQMIPGYFGQHCVPYFSPIFMQEVVPKKTGKGVLHLSFINVGYAEGVQDFHPDIEVLHRSTEYLVAKLISGAEPEPSRCAVISNITFEWIQQFCPEVLNNHPPAELGTNGQSSVHRYLDSVFLKRSTS